MIFGWRGNVIYEERWQEDRMIDYEEELKKFEPCLDVTDAESAIYDRELTDILDVLQDMLREAKGNKRRNG